MPGCWEIENIDNIVDQFILQLPCRVQAPYPSAEIDADNEPVADLLLAAFANGGNAEFTAIAQYINHHLTLENPELANMLLCISLVEMKHLDMVGTMIESLGGDPKWWRTNKFYWTGGYVAYGNTDCEKISLDILAEEEAISGYLDLIRQIQLVDGPGADQVIDVINRILDDERFHLQCFRSAFENFCVDDGDPPCPPKDPCHHKDPCPPKDPHRHKDPPKRKGNRRVRTISY